MAPQKNYQQDLQAPLISSPDEEQTQSPPSETMSERSSLLSDQLDVIIVQPEGHSVPSSRNDGHVESSAGIKSGKCTSSGMKSNKKKGPEVPVNCRHLETALFFFGIAGMIVSVMMLLQHIVSNLISYS